MGRKQTHRGASQQGQKNFQEQIMSMTLKKFQPYIEMQVANAAQEVADQQKKLLESLYLRARVLEDIVIAKFEDIDSNYLAESVADLQDDLLNMEKVETSEKGDRVRITIKTKSEDQEDFQGESPILVNNVGSGATLGAEIEGQLLGMKVGEVKEFTFGHEGKMTASVEVHRVSRTKKPEPEVKDADSNAQ